MPTTAQQSLSPYYLYTCFFSRGSRTDKITFSPISLSHL